MPYVPDGDFAAKGRDMSPSYHFNSPKFAKLKIYDRLFWGDNVRIVFDAHSPISSTGIDEIKHRSIIFIIITFLISFVC
jgi:hypothetical protein